MTPHSIVLNDGRIFETAETFSQKIYSTVPVSGRKADSGTVYPNAHGLVGQGDLLPPWVNVTIFSETTYLKNKTNTGIYKSKIMAKGEILGGAYLDSTYEISNNAMTLFQPLLFYSNATRRKDSCPKRRLRQDEILPFPLLSARPEKFQE